MEKNIQLDHLDCLLLEEVFLTILPSDRKTILFIYQVEDVQNKYLLVLNLEFETSKFDGTTFGGMQKLNALPSPRFHMSYSSIYRKKSSFNNDLLTLLQQWPISSPCSLPQLHAHIIKISCPKDVFLLTRLAHAYIKSNALSAAKLVFSNFPKDPPLFLWNEMIKGYSRNGLFKESIDLYYLMVANGVRPNEFTFTFVLPACAGAQSIADGRKIHEDVVKMGHERNAFVGTALVDMYGKCGEIELSRKVFDGLSGKGTGIFNAMIAGYTANNEHNEAMAIFDLMHKLGIPFDGMTMVSALQACASLGALQCGRWVHEQITRNCMKINVYMGAALVNMYARCGCINRSREVFDEMPHKDLICWTAVISGYSMHGLAEDAESLFAQMVSSGIKPDGVAFVGLLAGFSHRGLVDKGQNYFDRMVEEYHINPTLEHYSCMVDMLARAGKLNEAEQLIEKMQVEPDSGVLGSLLNACKIHGNVEVGERIIKQILTNDSENAGWYVLMSNIYATAKQWDGVAKMRLLMKERKVVKPPGWSSIEIKGKIHRFLVFDRSHPRSDEIYAIMKDLEDRIRLEGYVAETKCVLGNLPEDDKEDMLCGHSERLAIAFGILSTEEGDTLRIIKNLRVCLDCHTATKYISRITRREIIVRDAKRFHHFKNGSCSCGDYW